MLSVVRFVCPACRGELEATASEYACPPCARTYPVVCGIPDFRLAPDPYIDIEQDRRKAERLFHDGSGRSFEQLLRHYYTVTPEDPVDLAERWIAHALAEVEIASALVAGADWPDAEGASLLDIGCSTGALLVALSDRHPRRTGVDVALRWLAVGRIRLRDAGVDATLVCANAEYLPFPDRSFGAVTCVDTLEHVRDANAAMRQAYRVSLPGAPLLCTANNRLAPVPEPNIHLWGVGYLPRRWQAGYVKWRRSDLHPYRIRLMTPGGLRAAAVSAGYADAVVQPAPIVAPHVGPRLRRALRLYGRLRRMPFTGSLLKALGPRLLLRASATLSTRSSLSAAGRAGT
ncbi:MAG: methyltransferase domain-containing protein [Gemmatimonadaceae bacterium]